MNTTRQIVKGATSQILLVFIPDATSVVVKGLTALVFNSAGLTAYYKRDTAAASVAITLATVATLGTWETGGFKLVDNTNMPGWYELHVPNAALLTGANEVVFCLRGATDMVEVNIKVELTATNNQNATTGGITNIDVALSAIAAYVDTEVAAIKAKTDNLPASPANEATLTTIATYIDTEVAAIKAKTDNLPAAPAAVGDIPTLAQITAAANLLFVTGTTSGTPTTTSVIGVGADLSSTDDAYNGAFLVATSGVLKGVGRKITDYVGSTKTFSTQAFPAALASGVTLAVIGNVPS